MLSLRRFLDRLYVLGGAIAALFLVAILLIIVAQMGARWTGRVFPGSTAYAGYCMASASFFAFAYALNRGAHIRVSLFLSVLGRFRRLGEIWCFAIGSALSCYFAWYAVKAIFWSHKLNDISQSQDATPIWIPQLAMGIGTVLLAICFIDNLLRLLFTGESAIRADSIEDDPPDLSVDDA